MDANEESTTSTSHILISCLLASFLSSRTDDRECREPEHRARTGSLLFQQEPRMSEEDDTVRVGGEYHLFHLRDCVSNRNVLAISLPFMSSCLRVFFPQSHLKSCPYGLVHCPLKCGQGVTIKSLPAHMDTECPRRVIACEHCEEDIVLELRNDHENHCPKKPVVCNYCKNKSLLRGDLKEHLERCELKPRNCRLVPFGCKFSVSFGLGDVFIQRS